MRITKIFLIYCFVAIVNLPYALCADTNKTIYITSDDGPLRGTENVINVMTQKKTPITMFMVGLHYDNSSPSLKKAVDLAKKNPFIEIGNHSYTHANNHYRNFYHQLPDVIKDLKKNNTVFGFTGSHVNTRLPGRDVFRLPNLSKDDPYISKEEDKVERIDDDGIYKNGFYLYGWDLEWAHNQHGKPIQSLDELVQEIEDKFIAGCLPIIVQIPVFFSIYKVLNVTIEMRQAPFFGWIKDLSAPDPTSIFNLFGLLPFACPSFLMIGVWPILMALTAFLQQRMHPEPADPIQAQVMKFMPLVFLVMCSSFPAGVVIYWSWSNMLSIIQQYYINKLDNNVG